MVNFLLPSGKSDQGIHPAQLEETGAAQVCTGREVFQSWHAAAPLHRAAKMWDLPWPYPWRLENLLLSLHHLPFPIPISVHTVPEEPKETNLVLEEIDDDWINEATCEMMAWGQEAELVEDVHPLPSIQEEPQEEENR